jgi:SAM-dependent methyltransferase
MPCRSCGTPLTRTFLDLGETSLANSYLDEEQLAVPEPRYPLHARVCESCFLVQLDHSVAPEDIFTDYAYFSSYSDAWVEHARRFAESFTARLGLHAGSLVVEVASNDGYLLRHFRERGVPVLGVEPAANVAEVAVAAGIPTEVCFFGKATAARLFESGPKADLLVGNNVLAHVPDLNDFVGGMAIALAPGGVISIEVPHLLELIRHVEFDTIYHEHFSYFSLLAADRAFTQNGLRIFDVEELPTHGGSLRILACHAHDARPEGDGLRRVQAAEASAGLDRLDTYEGFASRVERCRVSLLEFLAGARDRGELVAAYGAAAKGNTLLNYCAVGPADIAFVVDRNPHKQGRYLPGSHIPIDKPDRVWAEQPDYLVLLPWNLRDEIIGQMADIRSWGGRFVIPIPEVALVE